MKSDAVLINIARGPIVDEVPFWTALQGEKIGALPATQRRADVYRVGLPIVSDSLVTRVTTVPVMVDLL